MAVFRKVHCSFWRDPFVIRLTPEQKYFYLYLMTNPSTKQCGIYEADTYTISHETGYNEATVKKLITFFESKGKVKFSEKTNEIALKNWSKYNDSNSPLVKKCIENELKSVKNRVLIQYVYSIDTQSQEEEEKEEEKEKTKEEEKEVVELPFNGDFSKIWLKWVEYKKKEHRFSYKTKESQQAALTELVKISGGNEQNAIEIIAQSMSNGWKGFFPLKKVKILNNGNSDLQERVQEEFNKRFGS
jgi:hypothetical protein